MFMKAGSFLCIRDLINLILTFICTLWMISSHVSAFTDGSTFDNSSIIEPLSISQLNNSDYKRRSDEIDCRTWNQSLPIINSIAVLWILTFVQVVCLIFGIIGNILAFIILASTAPHSNADFYLAVLAIFDAFSIFFSNFGMYLALYFRGLAHHYEWNLNHFFTAKWNQMPWCGVRIYLSFFTRTVSIWIVLVFTLERAILVKKPFLARRFSRKTAALALVGVIVTAALFNISYLWSFETRLLPLRGTGQFITACVLQPQFLYFNNVDVFLLMLFPLIIICTSNFIIFREINKRKENVWLNDAKKADQRKISHVSDKTNVKLIQLKKEALENRVSKRLMLVSTALVIFTLPMFVFSIARNIQGLFICYTSILTPPWSDLMTANLILYNMNFSVNYILYSLSDEMFQRKVFYLLTCQWELFKKHTRRELVSTGAIPKTPQLKRNFNSDFHSAPVLTNTTEVKQYSVPQYGSKLEVSHFPAAAKFELVDNNDSTQLDIIIDELETILSETFPDRSLTSRDISKSSSFPWIDAE